MAQDLDYEWEAYEKGWRGQSRQIKFTNEQLNIQIRHLTRKMKTEQESLRNEMSSREFIQRRKRMGPKFYKKNTRKKFVKRINSNETLLYVNKRIENIQNRISRYSKQIDQLNAQLNYNTY